MIALFRIVGIAAVAIVPAVLFSSTALEGYRRQGVAMRRKASVQRSA